jgi:aminoglycoside 6'-N-acetyltransferase
MEVSDLPLVARWLAAPHVARWWLAGSSVDRELDDLRLSVTGSQPVHALLVLDDDEPVGWCQWYLCADEPAWAADVGAAPGDVGIDYAIGEASRVGRGMGTELVAALVARVRTMHPGCGVIADPDERNVPSRRVLEKNGFNLVRVAALPSEPTESPVAVYRLGPVGTS